MQSVNQMPESKPPRIWIFLLTLMLTWCQTNWILWQQSNKWSIVSLSRPHKKQRLSRPRWILLRKSDVESLPLKISHRKCLIRGAVLIEHKLRHPMIQMVINCNGNISTRGYWLPHPMIKRRIISGAAQWRCNIKIVAGKIIQAIEIPSILMNQFKNVNALKINRHIDKCRL